MTMKMFKPKSITDDALYASSIAEPDTSMGEAEWVDPTIAQSLGSYSESDSNYTITGMVNYDGYIYAITTTTDWSSGSYNSYVIKINESSGATSSTVLGYEFSCVDVAINGSGIICFVGRSTVNSYTHLVYDTSDDSFTFNTSGAGSLYCVTSIDGATFDAFGADGYYVAIDTDASTTDNALATGVAIHAAINYGSYALVFGTTASSLNYVGTFNAADLSYTDILSGTSIGGYPSSRVASTGDYHYIATETGICKISVDGDYETIVSSGDVALRFFGNYTDGQFGARAGIGGLGVTSNGLLIYTAVDSTTPYGIGVYSYDTVSGESIELDCSNPDNVQGISVNGSITYIASYGSSAFSFEALPAPYLLGEQVIVSSTHRKYQCVDTYVYESPEDGATGEDGATWVDIGATNRWAALDFEISSTSGGLGNLDYWDFDIDETGVFDEVALFGLYNVDSVRFTIFDKDTSTNDYSAAESLDLDPVDDADDVYNDTMYNDTLVYGGLIENGLATGKILRVRIDSADGYDGDYGVGSICLGTSRTLGTVGDSSTVGLDDYSTYEYDDYGNLTTTVIPAADKGTYNLLIEGQGYRYTRAILKNAIGETCVWYSYDSEGNAIPILGRYTTSTITMLSPNTKTMPLKIKGVI